MTGSLLNIEKRILVAFKAFFNENYLPSQINTDIHVKMHKMCYFLSRIDCDIINFGFVWNTFGPFSVALQEVLKSIDQKPEALQAFYRDCPPEAILDEDVLNGIEFLRSGLQLNDHKGNQREWIELLGSLSFIAHSELPTSSFEYINLVLKGRKSHFESDTENRMAWDQLIEIGVAY